MRLALEIEPPPPRGGLDGDGEAAHGYGLLALNEYVPYTFEGANYQSRDERMVVAEMLL
jgi:hypothetical protein